VGFEENLEKGRGESGFFKNISFTGTFYVGRGRCFRKGEKPAAHVRADEIA